MNRHRLKRRLTDAAFGLSVLVLISPAVLVFLWMLSLSLKNELDNTAFPPVFIPDPPTLDNYREVFARNDFLLYAWNSVVVPSIGDSAAGSAVMTKKCSHESVASKPSWPAWPIGSSGVPWKQK